MEKERLEEFFDIYAEIDTAAKEMFGKYIDSLEEDANLKGLYSVNEVIINKKKKSVDVCFSDGSLGNCTPKVFTFPVEAFVDFDAWMEELEKVRIARWMEDVVIKKKQEDRYKNLKKKFGDFDKRENEYEEYLRLRERFDEKYRPKKRRAPWLGYR